jgi:hypothetical protein
MGGAMTQYYCYFIQKDGLCAAWRTFESESDGEAQDYALGLLAGFPHADKIEMWDGSRLTLSYSRATLQTPAEMRRLCYLAIAAARKETDPKSKQIIASAAATLAQEAEALERRAD